MGLFKSKRKEDEDFVVNYKPEEDFFSSEEQKDTPVPSKLTKEEILGTQKTEQQPQSDISPLEMLRRQMTESSQKLKEDEEALDFSPSFKINTDIKDDTVEDSEKPAVSDNSSTAEDDGVNAYEKEFTPTENNATAVNSTEPQEDVSVLQKCMPFILDGDEKLEEKPAYTLQSVNSILGIKEENSPEDDLSKTAVVDNATVKSLKDIPDISDIDEIEKVRIEQPTVKFDKIKDPNITDTKTIRIGDDLLGENSIDISSGAPLIKETDEEKSSPEQNGFSVPDDYKSFKDAKRIRIKLFTARRNAFLTLLASLFSLSVALIFRFCELYSENSPVLSLIACLISAVAVIANSDLFAKIKTVFKKRTSIHLCVLLAELACIAYAVYGIIKNVPATQIFDIILLLVFVLTFRSASAFMEASYLFTNFVQIGNKRKKHIVTLIDDPSATYAMARHSIDGEVLIAAPKEVDNATDYLTNSLCDLDFYGKVNAFLGVFLGVSLALGLSVGYYHADVNAGFSAFATVMCIFASPLVTLCRVLPLKRTSARLNKYSAMLTSFTAAEKIEQANAVALDCEALFPKGSVSLYQMKVLSTNDITDTLACAASITNSIHSPLANLFNKIMETNPDIEIPESDSIKYEENLGITGWIDKKRIYIGNRSLMAAHEIEIPDISIDRKILKRGYFPIYLACDGKACALLAVRYTPLPEISKELRRLSEMGVTMLISNCDQNITAQMLCDYFGLYDESVTIMSGSGVHLYTNSVKPEHSLPAFAAFGQKICGFASIITCAVKTVKSVKCLRFMYFATTLIALLMFVYLSFVNSTAVLSAFTVTAFLAVGYIISYITYLFTRP